MTKKGLRKISKIETLTSLRFTHSSQE